MCDMVGRIWHGLIVATIVGLLVTAGGSRQQGAAKGWRSPLLTPLPTPLQTIADPSGSVPAGSSSVTASVGRHAPIGQRLRRVALGTATGVAGNSGKSAVPVLRELGVPVKSVNWVRLHAGRNRAGGACLYATMGQNAEPLFVLQIDPETGATRQFIATVKGANYPTATLMSRAGKLYVGAAYAGHLLCFDPQREQLTDLGAIAPGAASFPCRLDEDASGRIWIGSFGTADLTCYDPKSGKFVRYGRMDDTDMYNYPLVNTDGTVACSIRMTRPHVVVFDPRTGAKKNVGPMTTKGKETLDLYRGTDGRLYIVSSVGKFRIDGTRAVPVDTVPARASRPVLPDGSTFSFADAADQTYQRLAVQRPDGQRRAFRLKYRASGNDIFCLHRGPDGCVYGSSILPLHLFRYQPRTGQLTDLGKCSSATGEAYSMATLGGAIYISSYPGARVSVFDPARPYHFGAGPDDNPRDLGRMDNISYRPRSTLAGPLGRIWLASLPDYGRWGGPLSTYDPRTGKRHAYYRIVGDASCYTLAHLARQKLLAVGTSISGGSGTRPKVKQATLFLWDYRTAKKVWQGTLERPVSVFNALAVGADNRLYGTVRGGKVPPELFVFDSESRTFIRRVPLPDGDPLDLGLQVGPDRAIYGFTSSCIYRLVPGSFKMHVLIRRPGAFGVAGPMVGKTIYFATGCRLRAVALP